MPIPTVLCIAGSDSSGASGIQADLKTLAALGVHGLSAVTAITAQSTHAVRSMQILSASALLEQLDAVADDFAIDAVKIGVLGSARNVRAVARWLEAHALRNVVLDPVLVSSSGRDLLTAAGRKALVADLLPRVDVLTPNLPEAASLLGRAIASAQDMELAAGDLLRRGPTGILLKGGHFGSIADDRLVSDYFADRDGTMRIDHPRLDFEARGTGCTLATSLAGYLALGATPRVAVKQAEGYLQGCLQRAFSAGNAGRHLLGHAQPGNAK